MGATAGNSRTVDLAVLQWLVARGAVALSPTRRSEAAVRRAVDFDGTRIVVRAHTGPAATAGLVDQFHSDRVRLAEPVAVDVVHTAGSDVTVEAYRHISGRSSAAVTPAGLGAAAAAFENATHSGAPRPLRAFPWLAEATSEHPDRTRSDQDLLDELARTARVGWAMWAAGDTPDGWTHGDMHAGNLIVDTDNTTWAIDLGSAGWGPIGIDLGVLLMRRRYNDTSAERLGATIAAYSAAGGNLDPERVAVELEPVVAAAEAAWTLTVATTRTPAVPALLTEARMRASSVLDQTAAAWTPLVALPGYTD